MDFWAPKSPTLINGDCAPIAIHVPCPPGDCIRSDGRLLLGFAGVKRRPKVNSIDYIVKPYDYQDIKTALDKFKSFRELFLPPEMEMLKKIVFPEKPEVKKRFLVKLGDRYRSVKSEDVSWFAYDEGLTFAMTFENTRFPVNYSIDQLSEVLDGDIFFQINRKYIIHIESIKNIHTWFNSRFKIELEPRPHEDIIVSRERAKDFKLWLDR